MSVSQPAGSTVVLTALTLIGFASNSILCRMALGGGAIDAARFTAVRLLAGAFTLALLAAVLPGVTRRGTWRGAAGLSLYAVAFSFAYLRLDAGVGALVLFAAVQATMIGSGIRSGERPSPQTWLGLALALAGMVVLTRPGLTAPDLVGCGLMAVAGVAWGAYSLHGRGVADPIGATAGNFVRTAPVALILLAVGAVASDGPGQLSGYGLAALSGSLASGGAYSLWYAVLPRFRATTAAILQLLVPVLAAAGGVLLLGEALTARLALSALAILGGVALAVARSRT